MENLAKISTYRPIRPIIYCYSTPGVVYHDGWVKIGYTEKQTAEDRIAQQTRTADIIYQLEWQEFAQYKDSLGGWFNDTVFHDYLVRERNVVRKKDPGKAGKEYEWFKLDAGTARNYFNDFADRRHVHDVQEQCEYVLRQEQQAAVEKTKAYFAAGGEEFLWNAKPRFGKTLAAYDLVRQMGCKKVLVVTNRPSIANSWADDFNKFIAWRGELCFVSELDAIGKRKGVLTRKEYNDQLDKARLEKRPAPGFIEFESLQKLKASVYFGGSYDTLSWLAAKYRDKDGREVEGLTFDLLIIDEAHEGVDTILTDDALDNISRKHTLFLSGTPFKALADGQFNDDQIFNWTYADEQQAKAEWDGELNNPYERLPRLIMFTYQMSNMICERINRGADISEDENVDYAFDLNEFFATNEAGSLVHEDSVKKFLHALTTQEKYPFSTPELRGELKHTLWLLNRVASAKALYRLLKEDPVFGEYEIVLAAGDGRVDDENVRYGAFERVREAIRKHDRTITLSVGQLTVGVTIPEWSGVLMLCNMQSPAAYMQAAFRAQNPSKVERTDDMGMPQTLRKENAYVFDFDPARTLIVYDAFANNLSPGTAGRGTGEERRAKIRELLNFFPVLGEDDQGRMVELDAAQVLSIPRRLKCVEVVRRGFMSNLLFQNIGNIFGAPAIVREILEKLEPAQEEHRPRSRGNDLESIERVQVDGKGEVNVAQDVVIGKTNAIFGPKIYRELEDDLGEELGKVVDSKAEQIVRQVRDYGEKIKKTVKDKVVEPALKDYKLPPSAKKQVERQVGQEIETSIKKHEDNFIQQSRVAQLNHDKMVKSAETAEEEAAADRVLQENIAELNRQFIESIEKTTTEIIKNKPSEVVEKLEKLKQEAEKKTAEDKVREHLRGFSRAIPSFIMAYGDRDLTLANFDDYTEDDVFLEVTGISEADFRFLRDGGDYKDPDTGADRHFEGHLFDETVFNDSIQEFLNRKEELADYFAQEHEEDIFDYIPPQKTNQIFTPRWIVKKMVDALEEECPGCFDDPHKTFADLYMKSGLYITEIVKRLFNSDGLKAAYPDRGERIRHIMREQVYGMAPTRIIWLIATNYILGFDESLKSETRNFVQGDAAAAAKQGRLEELVAEKFGSNRANQ